MLSSRRADTTDTWCSHQERTAGARDAVDRHGGSGTHGWQHGPAHRARRARMWWPGIARAGARAGLATEARVKVVETLEALVEALAPPRVVWLMLPAGAPTEETLTQLRPLISPGDVIVDGANAWYRDSMRRAKEFATSGHPLRRRGRVGRRLGSRQWLRAHGRRTRARRVRTSSRFCGCWPRHRTRAGFIADRAGPGTSRRWFTTASSTGSCRPMPKGSRCSRPSTICSSTSRRSPTSWRHGTVIRSWLLDLTAEFLAEDAKLESIAPLVADSGEGRWTAAEVDRARRADAGHDDCADGAVREPGTSGLCESIARAPAAIVRWSRGQVELAAASAKMLERSRGRRTPGP